jgi:dolichol-phosphate hexosyltransferase
MVDVELPSPGATGESAKDTRGKKLLIVIPALNEEDSIASIIERCLAAVPEIVHATGLRAVDVTVVSDGSTDQTVEIASRYGEWIDLIVFEKNKGYGAAIKEGWQRSDADLLGFLDADGTCDPAFFVPLCNAVIQNGVDVALGCRLNQDSKMPMLRRVGNTLFASLLSALSSSRVRDTASGMRVVRREALEHLYPLPNGLHFTPAMSARVMLSSELRMAELDMPYHEREGESKLRAGKDGLRFLKVILKTALLFRPSRLLGLTAIPFLVFAVLLLALPVADWLEDGEWPAGVRGAQAAAGAVLLTAAALLITAGYLAARIVEVVLRVPSGGRLQRLLQGIIGARWFWAIPGVLTVAGIAAGLVGGLTEGGGRGLFSMVVLGAAAVLAGVTRLLDRFVNVVAERLRYERNVAAQRAARA